MSFETLPATPKQIAYARQLAMRNGAVLPWDIQQDRQAISRWIEMQSKRSGPSDDDRPSSKQVAFAERIARARHRDVPDECYRSRSMMSRWIECNRH